MYRSLQDAADVTGDDRYGSGRTQIFYFNKRLFSKFSRGTRGLDLNAVLADLDNTHTRIGRVNETDLSEIFNMMQGEVWSPNGEANTMPAMSKTGHTSMSMGDVIMLPNGSIYMVDFSGFTNLNDGSKKMASRNVTASDRSALIRLASSLPAGSPERKAILAGLERVGSDVPPQVQALMNQLQRVQGVSNVYVTDTWSDGYFHLRVVVEPKESKNALGGWSGKIVEFATRANGGYGKFYNLPDYPKVAALIRSLASRSGLRVENIAGPTKVYAFQDSRSKAMREPRLSGYEDKEISVEVYVTSLYF